MDPFSSKQLELLMNPVWRCCLGGIRYLDEQVVDFENGFMVKRPYEFIPCICHLKPKMITWKKD